VKALLALSWVLAALPASAEEVWILQTGPEAVESIPLNPVQPVPSWRGLYSDGQDRVWVYATSSPQFYPPAVSTVRRIPGTGWTIAVFFPAAWKVPQQNTWLDQWSAEFVTLYSLPSPGWPVLFPSILRKG